MQGSPLNNQVQRLLSTKNFVSSADGVDQRPAKRARQEQPAVVEQQEHQQQAVAIDLTSGGNDAASAGNLSAHQAGAGIDAAVSVPPGVMAIQLPQPLPQQQQQQQQQQLLLPQQGQVAQPHQHQWHSSGQQAQQPIQPPSQQQLVQQIPAAAAPQAGAAPLQNQPAPQSVTIGAMSAPGSQLRSALSFWAVTCGIMTDTCHVPVSCLLPHWCKLLHALQLRVQGPDLAQRQAEVHAYLSLMHEFLVQHQQALGSTHVHYGQILKEIRDTLVKCGAACGVQPLEQQQLLPPPPPQVLQLQQQGTLQGPQLGIVGVPDSSNVADVADVSLGWLLQQLPSYEQPGSSSGNACNIHLLQLRQSATSHFPGLALSDIPAALVVLNHMCAVQEKALDCLVSGAGAAAPGDDIATLAAAAECLAVQQDVDALLQLAAQPVMMQLVVAMGLQGELGQLHAYVERLGMSCQRLAASASL